MAYDAIMPVTLPSLSVSIGAYSQAGTGHPNHDAFAARLPDGAADRAHRGVAACVSDGLSSSERAAEASRLAVTQFLDDYASSPATWSTQEAVRRSLTALNAWLHRQGLGTGGAAATFSGLVLKGRTAHLFQIGDSAVFLLRGGRVRRLTKEHRLPERDGRGVLTAALGADEHLTLAYDSAAVDADDVFVLLTDGVSDVLPTHRIAALLSERSDLDEAARVLCDAAAKAGSTDDATAMIVSVDRLPPPASEEGPATTYVFVPPLEPGQAVDDFEVVRVLHSGVRSRVYRVRLRQTGDIFVLKAPSRRFEDDPGYLAAFEREAWVGQQVSGRQLMRTYPKAENSPYLYLLCEWVEGHTLRQWMRDNPQPDLAVARDMLHQIISALRTLHRAGIVHRDLKPENLMVRPDGTVTIIDYGSVLIEGLDEVGSPEPQNQGEGSLGYAAPEFILGDPANRVSDIFSVGVITYELLCGALPFKADLGANGIPASIAAWRYISARSRRADLPDFVDAALETACQPDPARRLRALSELERDISRPGPLAKRRAASPALLDRNPTAFWQLGCVILAAIIVVLLCLR